MSANTLSEQMRLSENFLPFERVLSVPATGLYVFTAWKKCKVNQATLLNSVISGAAGTVDLRVLRAGDTTTLSGTAGETLVASTWDATQTANTPVTKSGNGEVINAGDKVFVYPSTTLTSLAGIMQVLVEPLE